jgi:hypothetical protein
MFRDMVRQFAEEQIAPLAHDMDRDGRPGPRGPRGDALRAGPHGHRDPGGARRRGRVVLHVGPGGGGAVPGRSRGGGAGGRAEHAGRHLHHAVRQRRPASRYLPAWPRHGGRLRPVGGGLRLRRLRPPDPGPPGRRRLDPGRDQALDHQRRRGGALHRVRQRQPGAGLQGDHRVPGGAGHGPASWWGRRRTSWGSGRRPRWS